MASNPEIKNIILNSAKVLVGPKQVVLRGAADDYFDVSKASDIGSMISGIQGDTTLVSRIQNGYNCTLTLMQGSGAIKTLLDLGDVVKANRKLEDLAARVGWRWRLVWFKAVSELLTGDFSSASGHFTDVLNIFPGELAPKLALAAAAELAGTSDERRFYETVWHTDNNVISAGFGLARAQSAEGDRQCAVTTLDEVPISSRHFTTARLTSAVTLLSGRSMSEITERQIRDAARRVEALPETEPRVLQIRALVLGTAMDWIAEHSGSATASTDPILGYPFTDHGLRLGVEASLRSLARVATSQAHRYALVDMANQVRPMTTF